MSQFLQNLHAPVDASWHNFLTTRRKSQIRSIEKKIARDEIRPDQSRVLHFLTVPLDKIQVIILGQDPYPAPNAATGRAFEVGTLTDWSQPFRQGSLKNIVRLIYKTYYGEERSFKAIRDWNHNSKAILPPHKLFKSWEKQGVLLLNTALTCKTGVSASHSSLWQNFSGELLRYINNFKPEAHWILWGGHAQKITADLELQNPYASNHPMMCSAKNSNDFLYGGLNTFETTKKLIDWRGK